MTKSAWRLTLTQQPIEMILLRQWASYIAVPMWIADSEGNLIYYHEPAEALVGAPFDEAGEINATAIDEFMTADLDGEPIPNEELPLVIALVQRIPAHRRLRFQGLDGSWHEIEVTAIPIEAQGGRHLGALAAFWETTAP